MDTNTVIPSFFLIGAPNERKIAKSIIEKKANNMIFNSVTIPHGVDPKFRRESNKNLICPDQFPDEYFLYVSTLDVYKAQVEVVKAYSLLKSRKSKIPKLIFIGSEYAAYGKKVREVIKKNNMVWLEKN